MTLQAFPNTFTGIGSFEQLDLLVGMLPLGIAVFDRDMCYLMANPRWLDNYGLNGESIIGYSHYQVCPNTQPYWQQLYERALSGESLENDRDPILNVDGTAQATSWRMFPWFDKKNMEQSDGIDSSEHIRIPDGIVVMIQFATDGIDPREQSSSMLTDNQLRAKELETVSEVSAATATILDLENLLQTVVNLTKDRFGLYHAHIYLLNDAGDTLEMANGAGEAGRLMKEREHKIALDHPRSLVARCARSRTAVIVNDVRSAPDFLPNILLPDTRAEMAVPMVVGDELVGVLDLQSDKLNNFTEIKARIKTILGNQIAIAVQNARAFSVQSQEAQKQIRDIRGALDQSAIVAITDQTGKITFANDKFCEISKYSREELIGQDHRLLNSGYHSKEFMRNLWVTIANGKTWHGELCNRAKDGSNYWVDTTIVPFLNQEGKPRQYIAIRYDITSSKLLEIEARQRATNLEATLSTVRQASTLSATLENLDELLHNVANLTKESFQLYHAHIYLLDDAGQQLVLAAGAGAVGKLLKAQGHTIPLNRESSIVASVGRTRQAMIVNDVHRAASFLPNALLPDTRAEMAVPMIVANELIGVLDIQSEKPDRFTDVDVQVQTSLSTQVALAVKNYRTRLAESTAINENELRARELETVSEVSAAAATILDPENLLQSVVELTKDRFGLYHAHIYLLNEAGDTLEMANGAGEAGRLMKEREHKIALDHPRSLVARCARSRTAVIVNDVRSAPDFLPNILLPDTRAEMAVPMVVGDELVGVLDLQSDKLNNFTETKARIKTILGNQIAVAVQNARQYAQQTEVAEQLRTVDRLKSEFLASMSHELRTPLNSIIGYSRMLLDGVSGDLPEDVNEDLDAIHYGGQHLLSLINDILDLAKIEAGRFDIDPQPVNLTHVAEEVARMTSVLVIDKPVSIVFDIAPEIPDLSADIVRLRQILNNLISNAIKFTERGEVRLKASYENGAEFVWVSVSDMGTGIDPERLPYVFERFYQADSSSSRRAGGTGLGLTITQHLVNMHGGRIWAESTLGKGSTFTFTLPVAVEKITAQ